MQETYLEMKSQSIKFALRGSYPFVNVAVVVAGGINLKPYTVSYTRSFIIIIKPDDPPRPALSRARA